MKIIIAGAGEVGCHLAKLLGESNHEITIIDNNSDRLAKVGEVVDAVAVFGNPTSISVLQSAKVDTADLFVAVFPDKDQNVNIVSALLAKELGAKKVTARINTAEYLSYENKSIFTQLGIDLMFYPERMAAYEIADLVRESGMTEFVQFGHGKLQLIEFKIEEDSPLIGREISDFVYPIENLPFRIVAISRGGKTIIPSFDTPFKNYDYLYIICGRNSMPALIKYLGKDQVDIRRVMILGGSEIGVMVAGKLAAQKVDEVKLIEIDPKRCRTLSAALPSEVNVTCGDARDSDFLLEEDLKGYQAILAVTGNDEVNILTCVAAKKMGVPRVIAQVENLDYIRLAEEMGVDSVVNKKLTTASRIFKFTLSDKVRSVRYMSGTDAEVLEYTAAPGSKITKGILKDIDFPANAIIGGVIRGGDSFIAVGHSHIEAYDRVAVFALPDAVKEVDKMFK